MAIDRDTAIELNEYAIDDAAETIRGEQLAYFYCDVSATNPPMPKRQWLKSWLGRSPSDKEMGFYSGAYVAAMSRAIRVIDAKFNPECEEDALEHENEVTELAIAAMSGKNAA